MAQKFIGLDLGTHEVKAVLVSAGLRTVQVLEVHEEAVVRGPQGDDSLEAAIEVAASVLRKRGWNHYPVGVVLPGGVGSYRVLRFPFGDPRRIAQAIAFEVEGQFPVPVEQLALDHLVVSGTRNLGQALVAAVRKEVIERVSVALEAEKLDIKSITVPPLALAQVLDAPAPAVADPAAAEGRIPVALVIDVGHRNSELVAVGPKGPVAARSLRRGGFHVTRAIETAYRLDAPAAEAKKQHEGVLPHPGATLGGDEARLAAVIAKAFEPLIREIEHTRLWLRAEVGCEVTVIRLVGGGSGIRGLAGYLGEQTGVAVEEARPRESSTLKKVEGRDWSGATAALGAAVAASRRPLIQLYKDAGSRGSEGNWLAERMSTLAAIGIAVLAFGALDTFAKLKAYELEEEAYAGELAASTKAVFGEEILDVGDLEAKLRAVEGGDITSLVASRSALDVLSAMIKVSSPKGPKPAMPAPGVEGEEGEEGAEGQPPTLTAFGAAATPGAGPTGTGPDGEPAGAPAAAGAASGDAGGITWDDELVFDQVEIRARKIELTASASASRLSAQSRLKRRLMTISCVSNVQEGKARDANYRKVFEMSIEHDCLFQSLEEEA
ncbi:MAG: pilus assembly protein PilM [Myxococcales bacterium]|nr:pilus assembly protein PilM [Myxococcales bacterium]